MLTDDRNFTHKSNYISRSIKTIAIHFLIGIVKIAIGIKKLVVFFFRKIGALLGFIIKKLFKKPAILLYRQLLKAQFRLASLGVEIKNPFIYAISSRTLGYVLLLGLSTIVIIGNIVSREQDLDFFQPKSIIARLIVNEDDQIFMEEYDTTAPSGTDYSPFSGVKAPSASDGSDNGNNEDILTGEPGDITQGSGAIIKPVIPPSNTEEPAVASPETPRSYVVAEGDSLGLIARKFGLKTSTILLANGLNENSTIKPGQRLVILPTDGVIYRIKKGDSLSKIAQKYNTDIEGIVAYNKLTGPTDIRIGEQIILPGGTPPGGSGTPTEVATPEEPKQPRYNPSPRKEPTPPIPSIIARSPGMIWPTTDRGINQYFSWRHTGVDIHGHIGNYIYAASSGTVVISQGGYNGGYGNTVLIDHGNGLRTRYGHASKLLVSKGDYVTKGQVIALLGSTGRSTGPHLHFEVLVNGKRVNPLGYIRQ